MERKVDGGDKGWEGVGVRKRGISGKKEEEERGKWRGGGKYGGGSRGRAGRRIER